MTEAVFKERLQAIIDWADIAVRNPADFNSHGVRNLQGPVFDAARKALSGAPRTVAGEPEHRPPLDGVATIEAVMEQAQVFASTYSLVGGRFDDGSKMRQSEEEKDILRSMVASLLAPATTAFHVQGGMPSDPKTSAALMRVIEAAKLQLIAMSDEERSAMWQAQRECYVRGFKTPCEHGALDFEQCDLCRSALNLDGGVV